MIMPPEGLITLMACFERLCQWTKSLDKHDSVECSKRTC